jgi:hypothetical protein
VDVSITTGADEGTSSEPSHSAGMQFDVTRLEVCFRSVGRRLGNNCRIVLKTLTEILNFAGLEIGNEFQIFLDSDPVFTHRI